MKVENFMVEVLIEVEGKKQGVLVQEFQHQQYGTVVEGSNNQTYSLRLTNNTQDIVGAKFWIDGQQKGMTTTLRQQKPKVLKGFTLSKDAIHESKPSDDIGVIKVSFYPVEMKEKKRANTAEPQETTTKRAGPKYHISSNNPIETLSLRYFTKETLTQMGFTTNTTINNPPTQTTKTANSKKRQKKTTEPTASTTNNNNNNMTSSSSDLQMDMPLLFTSQPDSHDPRYIWISVRNQESKSVAMSYFMILKNSPLKHLQQTYSKQHNTPPPTFIVNGIPLPNECTPDQLGLRDGAVLQASFHGNPGTDDSENALILRVRYKHLALKFKINKDDSMSKLMESFCRKKSIDVSTVVFTFDGYQIQSSATIKSLHLENEDLIEVLPKEVAEKQTKTKHEPNQKQHQQQHQQHQQQHQQYQYSPSHVMNYPYPSNPTTAAYLQAMQNQSAPFMFYRHPDTYQENHDG